MLSDKETQRNCAIVTCRVHHVYVSQRNHLVSVGGGWLLWRVAARALPCEALERRRLWVDAQRHARRLQLLRYKLVDLLCEHDQRNS